MKPAGFWRRIAARLIDSAILAPVNLGIYFLTAKSRDLAIFVTLALFPLGSVYFVFCHQRWGQTLGKMILRAKVVTLEGAPVTFLQAVLRSSVEIGFACLTVAFTVMGMLSMTAEEYAVLGWQEQAKRMAEAAPGLALTNTTSGLWIIASGIALLSSPLKRALHDLIAGTKVVVLDTEALGAPVLDPAQVAQAADPNDGGPDLP